MVVIPVVLCHFGPIKFGIKGERKKKRGKREEEGKKKQYV